MTLPAVRCRFRMMSHQFTEPSLHSCSEKVQCFYSSLALFRENRVQIALSTYINQKTSHSKSRFPLWGGVQRVDNHLTCIAPLRNTSENFHHYYSGCCRVTESCCVLDVHGRDPNPPHFRPLYSSFQVALVAVSARRNASAQPRGASQIVLQSSQTPYEEGASFHTNVSAMREWNLRLPFTPCTHQEQD